MKLPRRQTVLKGVLAGVGLAVVAGLLYLDSGVRGWYVGLAGRLGPVSVPFLRYSLNDPVPAVQQEAMDGLRRLGPAAVPALQRSLADPDPEVRLGSVKAAIHLGEGTAGLVPDLAAAVKDPDPRVRSEAVHALLAVIPPPAVAYPAVLAARHDPDPAVQKRAEEVAAIYQRAADPAAAADVLIGVLKAGGDPVPRADAARALGRFARGEKAAAARAALAAAAEDSDERVRTAAKAALNRPADRPDRDDGRDDR
jgi:HEAT repeat protein